MKIAAGMMAGAKSMLSARGAGQLLVIVVAVVVVLALLIREAPTYTPEGLAQRWD